MWTWTVALAACWLLALPASAMAVGSISGAVTSASGGAPPIPGVEVCAWESPEEEEFGCAFTNGAGTYQIPNLTSGNYKVEFWPTGNANFIPQYFSGKSTWASADVVTVPDGVNTPNVNAALVTGGWISGRVTDAATQAGIGGIAACAFPIDEVGFGRCALTAASGDYQLNGLATDTYQVVFAPEGEGGYSTQVYDGKRFSFEATPVGVTTGLGTAGINARLQGPVKPVLPATPTIPVTPPLLAKPKPAHKPLRCKKGFRKKRVKGKARCVKLHKPKKRRGSGKGRKAHR